MSPLPRPLSSNAQNTGMPRQRRKSSLRTAAGALQDQFLDRMERLAADPTVVLARTLDKEPAALAKLRRGLERLTAGKVPLAARFDAHILGATYRAMQLADWDAVPRLLDAKIAGQRRFYIQRGQVVRACSLGVQNYDQPRVLLLAYAAMAKKHGLHFVAMADHVLCLGKSANPPDAWFTVLGAGKANLHRETDERHGCGHADRDRVHLGFAQGPTVAVCGPCGDRLEGLHRRLRERYVGPEQKRPVTVRVQRAGSLVEPSREASARYRAGMIGETELLRSSAGPASNNS